MLSPRRRMKRSIGKNRCGMLVRWGVCSKVVVALHEFCNTYYFGSSCHAAFQRSCWHGRVFMGAFSESPIHFIQHGTRSCFPEPDLLDLGHPKFACQSFLIAAVVWFIMGSTSKHTAAALVSRPISRLYQTSKCSSSKVSTFLNLETAE